MIDCIDGQSMGQLQNGKSDNSYFVCTLGEAEAANIDRPFRNVNHLIDKQATEVPNLPAIGFYRKISSDHDAEFQADVLNFKQLYEAINASAEILSKHLLVPVGTTVGLLSSSSPEFLLTWLGCIRLGHPVLLIAPQCSYTGVVHLCRDSGAAVLLVDDSNAELGKNAVCERVNGVEPAMRLQEIPFDLDEVLQDAGPTSGAHLGVADIKDTDIAYLHHTSGTSSGMPKPIPQIHHGAVGVLPALDGSASATFTTTPLYHGGPADIFRAWASSAMIWLFPSHEVSITAKNIVRCLESAHRTAMQGLSPAVEHFASVPYILQMMAEHSVGIEWLARMRLVGTGGAALPQPIGDELVGHGINLVSRFGSAECGFLLSSHRQYVSDKDWQYLRLSSNSRQLRFEPRTDGLAELIVMPDWPHMAKRDRPDGSYATSDLFEPHPRINNAWRYHSRADGQLTLMTGKKFAPEPIEAALVAASKHVCDALIFGNDRPYAGALLFRNRDSCSISDEVILQCIAQALSRVNEESASHARISSNMLVLMPYSEAPLPKSSKGTIIRKTAEEKYASQIEAAYHTVEGTTAANCSDSEIPAAITGIIDEVLRTKVELSEEMDFFALGVDSIAAMQIRQRLQRLLPKDGPKLPVSVVEDTGDVKKLSEYILASRHGGFPRDLHPKQVHQYMKQLVDDYSTFEEPSGECSRSRASIKETVLLTGATGALGAHVLDQLRTNTRVAKVICLVRGADAHAAHERVNKALEQRQLRGIGSSKDDAEVEVVQAVLRNADLGVSKETYNRLSQETTTIVHLAWSVNFRMKLWSFAQDSIASLRNLINLALAAHDFPCPSFVFCSSVASSMAYAGSVVPENILHDPASATDVGYSQSKWVAEHVCHRASQMPRLHGKVSIFRVGQLSGDTKTGVWNAKEAWPLMLSSMKLTKSLPNLGDVHVDWVPVDVAAAAMIEGSLLETSEREELVVYHLLNNRGSATWDDLLFWARKRADFDSVQPQEWIRQLELAADNGSQHPALQLLDHWRESYKDERQSAVRQHQPAFSTSRSDEALPSMRLAEGVDEAYFEKLWVWIQSNM